MIVNVLWIWIHAEWKCRIDCSSNIWLESRTVCCYMSCCVSEDYSCYSWRSNCCKLLIKICLRSCCGILALCSCMTVSVCVCLCVSLFVCACVCVCVCVLWHTKRVYQGSIYECIAEYHRPLLAYSYIATCRSV